MKCAALLLVLLAASPTADQRFARGVRALKAKNAELAVRQLSACVKMAPGRVDCRWELGWAHYLRSDWSAVVQQWQEVKRLDPDHPEVNRHLPAALRFMQAEARAAQARERAPASLPRSAPSGEGIRIRAVGDVMLGTAFPEGYLPPKDGAHLLDDVAPLLRDADLTFANLEGPLCDAGETKKCKPGGNCYAFRSPTRYGEYIKAAGVDVVSTANNHAEDFGIACRLETEATLERLGIAYSGRPGTVASMEVQGRRVAMIGFHSARTGHFLNDHETARTLVAGLAADHDIVIVSFHGGAEGGKALHVPDGPEEFYGEKRGDLRTFSHLVVDAGADLVIGHGPHVLRGMEIYRDRLIAYSLGNFATFGRFNLSGYLGVGAVLEVEVDAEGRFVAGKLLPTEQIGKGVPMRDAERRGVDLVRRLSREDFAETGVRVAKDGSLGRR